MVRCLSLFNNEHSHSFPCLSADQRSDLIPHWTDHVPPFQPGKERQTLSQPCFVVFLIKKHNCVLFQEELSSRTDLVQSHRERISKSPLLANMEQFWKAYNGCIHSQLLLHLNCWSRQQTQCFCFVSLVVAETWTLIATTPSSKCFLNINHCTRLYIM